MDCLREISKQNIFLHRTSPLTHHTYAVPRASLRLDVDRNNLRTMVASASRAGALGFLFSAVLVVALLSPRIPGIEAGRPT
jgi:hypothetical protein